MIEWRIHHKGETESTNDDARNGSPGDVYSADYQTSGRGRIGHKWFSPRGANLMMSVVLDVSGIICEEVATLPLLAGLAVARGIEKFTRELNGLSPEIKWPNDILIGDRKIAGILCERHGERVTVGVGVNVRPQMFPAEIAHRATFVGNVSVEEVRDSILANLAECYDKWLKGGFMAVHGEVAEMDWLKGRVVAVKMTDEDSTPIKGVANGIMCDGSLDVGGVRVYSGEAHVEMAAQMD